MSDALKTNCLTEIFSDKATERAEILDKYLTEQKRPNSPLHRIPISLEVRFQFQMQISPAHCLVNQDSYNIRTIRSTAGYLAFDRLSLPDEHSSLERLPQERRHGQRLEPICIVSDILGLGIWRTTHSFLVDLSDLSRMERVAEII